MFGFGKKKEAAATTRDTITVLRSEWRAVKQRAFDAAKYNRLRAEWTTENTAIDTDTRTGLHNLRARSRDAEANNPTGLKYLNMTERNIVGPFGFSLQVKAMKPDGITIDTLDSKAVRDAYRDWGAQGNCDITGKLTIVEIQQMLVRARFRDGEFLVRKHRGKKYGKYGFQLQVLDTDRLDIELNKELPNGNIIKMGVELDGNSKPVAYHIRVRHPGDIGYYWRNGANVYERVPAEDIIHGFKAIRPEQTRGIPAMHAGLINMEHGGKFQHAALTAAEIGASNGGFWTSDEGTAEGLADDEDDQGQLYTDVEPGQIGIAPPGYELTETERDYPSALYGPFVKENKRESATAFDVAYHVLANDLEGVNFSSIRAGTLDERDGWMAHQEWFKGAFLDDIYKEWVTMALLVGAIKDAKGNALPSWKLDKYINAATWMGRRWPWVDPYKDMQTAVLGVQQKLKTRRKTMAENGDDFDDSIDEMAVEDKKMKDAGIVPPAATPNKPSPADAEEPPA